MSRSAHSLKLWTEVFIRIFGLGALVFMMGCLPKEVPMTTATSSDASKVGGFVGIKTAETQNGSRVLVTWTESTDPNVVAYNIYDASFRFAPRLVKTVAAPADRATLTGLTAQNLYSYRVRAADKDGNEDANTVDLKAIPYAGATSVTITSSSTARIVYADGSNSDEVQVYCKTSTEAEYSLYRSIRNTSLTQVDITGLVSATNYSCRVALEIDGFVDNNKNYVEFTPMGQATQMVIDTQPGNGNAGQNLSQQPVFKILDANGNLVTGGPDATAQITLTLASSSPSGGTIRGTAVISAVGGIATFTNLNFQEAGQKILTATKADTSGQTFGSAVMTVDTSTFSIAPGNVSAAESTIAVTSNSSTGDPLIANGTDTYTVTITLKDSYGNAISGIRPQFASSISGDTLTQPTVNTNASGVTTGVISSTIADLSPNLRKLTISSPSGLSSVEVNAPFVHGPAMKLGYLVQPINSPAGVMGMSQIQVSIQDAQGNKVNTGTGATSTVSISIASNSNGALLSGTTSATASAGVAIFSDLGIDKTANGYRLVVSSGSLTPAYSNTFNITAGIPRKIAITAPSQVVSGACSTAITVQLQDLGNNPANAIQTTPVTISGLGQASLYTSNVCGGAAASSTLNFTAGTNTRTLYLKDNKAEALTISIADSSAVMTTGTANVSVGPNKLGLLAQAAAPAPAGTPLTVVAGTCSTAIVVTPMGENGNPGPTFVPTPVAITGFSGTSAKLYSDSSCTNEVSPLSVTLPINTGPTYTTSYYVKDLVSESLLISISDGSAVLTTVTSPQSVEVLPSQISMTGPSSVVAGTCSTAFSVRLNDAMGTPTTASADKTLTINGIPGTSVGKFYTSSSCSGTGSASSITFPQGANVLQIYFKSVASDDLNLSISDPAGKMSASTPINLKVSPSALQITKPVAGTAKTNICAGPFTVKTVDGVGTASNAVTPLTVNLAGAGTSAAFYSDAACTLAITSLSISTGQNQKDFYLLGYFPESNLNLTAVDAGSVLSTGTSTWQITGAKAWLGTSSKMFDSNGDLLWFRTNVKPVAARFDGIRSVRSLAFSPDYRYLYVGDDANQRILKFDYQNHTYIGWIGGYITWGGVPISGSNLPVPSSAQCVNTLNDRNTPGWCVGGTSYGSESRGPVWGTIAGARAMVDDGTYLYVAGSHMVTRYDSETGAYRGFLGFVTSNTGMSAAPGGPGSCTTMLANTPTPGWCYTTAEQATWNGANTPQTGDGRFGEINSMAYDDTYLYVGSRYMIGRYNRASGAFAGWIGMVSSTPTSGAAGCNTRTTDQMTPGWCFGGSAIAANPLNHGGLVGGLNYPVHIWIYNDILHVGHTNGNIVKYDRSSGAVLGAVTGSTNNWAGAYGMAHNGDRWFFSDEYRVIKTDNTGMIEGWVGKVSNNSGISGPGCTSLAANANTPGWCLGGTTKRGLEEGAFHTLRAIAYDGNGKLIVGQGYESGVLRRYDVATGAYEGTLSLESTSPTKWSTDASSTVQLQGYDSDSMYNPRAMYVNGDDLFVVDELASRVKRINRKTGQLIGWIGGTATTPTGGETGCIGANPFAASPNWCLGAIFNPYFLFGTTISSQSQGVLYRPRGITGDGTYIYVTDKEIHRIMRFRISDGAPQGWIGRIGTTPASGAAGCSSAAVNSFTPGWCNGGYPTSGNGDGHLAHPTDILYAAGNLYVWDSNNLRISSYNATTGSFNGWIGRINAAPSGGCTTGSNGDYTVSQSGWCLGGTAQGGSGNDRGGGFTSWDNHQSGGLATDGASLYIVNFYNRRIDKYSFTGVFQGAVMVRSDIYNSTWTTDPATLASMGSGCGYPISIWTDGTSMYGIDAYPCQRANDTFGVFKMDLATGTMVGWHGGIDPSQVPYGGDSGCAGATADTPGWCQGGRVLMGTTMGYFASVWGYITGDSHFVYVSDTTGNRVLRIPK